MEIIILFIVFLFGLYLLKKKATDNSEQTPSDGAASVSSKVDYSNSYKRKYLFSRNEKTEARKLLEWADKHGYYIFPKVRLLDIIEPRDHRDKSLLWKIQAKHIDFLVCDKSFKILFLIELDDNSHDRKDRSERDEFVRQALRGSGYTLLHTRGISDEFLASLKTDEK